MSSSSQSKTMLDLMKEGKQDMSLKLVPSIKNENERGLMDHRKQVLNVYAKQKEIKEHGLDADNLIHEGKKIKESGDTMLEKLKSFFECVQKQHPESRLELQNVDGSWKVWCGACKKLLRPDKSGKAIHNIQRQHFASSRHKKKLHLMLQGEEEEAERQRKHVDKSGNAVQP